MIPSDPLFDQMFQDAEEAVGVPIPRDEDFRSISSLVDEQLTLEAEIEAAEELLKAKKEELRVVQRTKLPTAISRFGLSEFKLTDGSTVSIKEEVRAGITAEKHDEAMRWLEETGHDDIVKNEVSLSFGKGQDAETRQLLDVLNERGYSYENKRFVHPMTLKAFVGEQIRNGHPVPIDTFSVFVEKVAKIKLPRKR